MSKYRNVFGETLKEKWFNLHFDKCTTEGNISAANKKFFACSYDSTGAVVVLDSNNPVSVKPDQPLIKGHQSPILDLEFSPFNPNLLLTGSDDCSVKLWQIPDEGLTEIMKDPVQTYAHHFKKVFAVRFNPVVSDVVCSTGADSNLSVWNLAKAESYVDATLKDYPTSVNWNENGSLVAIVCKNKKLTVFDPRANKFILEVLSHDGSKSQKLAWIDENQVITLGFHMNVKELKLWDVRKASEDLTCPEVEKFEVDHSPVISSLFVDKESKLVYTFGKGEGLAHIIDYNEGTFKKGLPFSSTDPVSAICMVDRKSVQYNKCEIDRFIKVMNNGNAVTLSFKVPRKIEMYDPSVFPPVSTGEPSLTYDQWVGGETKGPIKKPIDKIGEASGQAFVKEDKGSGSDSSEVAELKAKIKNLEEKVKELTAENEKLKADLAAAKESGATE